MIKLYEEARQAVLAQIPDPAGARLPLTETRDLIVMEDIVAKDPLPAQNYAAMNGYAVRSEDTKGATKEFPVEGKMVERLSAGQVRKRPLGKNEVVRVVAGSLLPANADAVVLSEDADRIGKSIKIYRTATAGENVRMRGEDIEKDEMILKKGRRIRSQEITMLAALGIHEVPVYPRPKTAILTTGAELASLGQRRGEGQVWNCLAPMLRAMVEEAGGQVVDLEHVSERSWSLKGKIREGLNYPIFILAGGIFVREYDLIRDILDSLRVKEVFWRVNMRPGRPIYFGRTQKTLVFGVPDTPGSVFVGFEEFIRPALLKLLGRERLFRREITAVAGTDIKNKSRRMFFVRSFLRRNGRNVTVFPSGNQHSHIIKTLSRSNALVALDEGQEFVRRGERVKVRLLD